MQTRLNRCYTKGFYKQLHNLSSAVLYKKKIRKRESNIRVNFKGKAYFQNQLKYNIWRQLSGNVQTRAGNILLTTYMRNFLIKKYNLSNKYKEGMNILKFLKISTTRFLNEKDYCQIQLFNCRIYVPPKISSANEIVKSASFFSYKFLKSNEVLS